MSAGCRSGRPETSSSRLLAWPRRASGLLADSTQGTSSGFGPLARSSAGSSAGSSRMACAFVPLIPNDETAARRGLPVSGHGRASVSSDTAPADQSTCGDGSSTCRVRGTTPWRIASTIFITLPTPAAAWVWPMFDLSEPSSTGRSAGRSWPYVASSACASIGSPSFVPVPCASTTSMSVSASCALATAWRITLRCDGPLGAVSPLLAPSWFTAVPRTTARMSWPCRRASDRRSSSTMPTPSLQPTPSAAAEKALHRPSAANPPCRVNSEKVRGVAITVAPPASASEHSPCRSDCAARCTATSEEEQAVSTVTAGPSRPNVYATRPEATLGDTPVIR